MNDQFESKITKLGVAHKIKDGLRNSPALIVDMACVSRLDLDHFAQIQMKGQLDSASFNQRLPSFIY